MRNKRNKIFSIAIGALACVALPAAAQDGSRPGSGFARTFQGLYQEIASWFGLTSDEPEVGPFTMPGGQTLTEDPEMGGYTMPGGLWAPGDSANVAPYIPVGGRPTSGDSPEAAPFIMPGGLWAPGASTNAAPYGAPGGNSATGDSPEMSPITFPSG